MPFTRCSVPACRQVVPVSLNLLFRCQFAHEKRNVVRYTKGHVYRKGHATCAPDNNTSWLFARDVQSHKLRSVRSGFPCECVSSHFFVGYTCQLCPSYGCWHHVRGLVSSIGHLVDAHLERRQFDCGPCVYLFWHVTSFVLLWLSQRPLETVGGAHPFAVPNRTLSHGERTFAPTQVGHVCDRVSSRACS